VVGAQKKPVSGRRATKPAQRRSTEIAKNPKNIETYRKAIQQNTKTNTRKQKQIQRNISKKQGNPKNKGSTGGKPRCDLAGTS
jgi:hypothetical protein